MRLGMYNVENLFDRATAMNQETWKDGRQALDDFHRLSVLTQKESYSDKDKAEMLTIMRRHKGLIKNGTSTFLCLRENRGDFIKVPKKTPAVIVANGRGDWIGWFDLETESVKETSTENTARVIKEINVDVLCVVEAEDRTALKRFNRDVIPNVEYTSYDHVMLIDGNDERGIDVGIMTRKDYSIQQIASHVDDVDDKGIIFSRDCPEYLVQTSAVNKLLVLINHFKSKGYGSPKTSNEKRMRQAKRVREIYEERLQEGYEFIAIAGDLNNAPDSGGPLDPLLNGSGLLDVMSHSKFVGDDRPGTHGNGAKDAKFDYILMSPKLQGTVQKAGIERRGVWGGKNGTLFPHLPEIKSSMDAASDHAALWVQLDI